MEENIFWLTYRTGTNNNYPIEVQFKSVSINELVYEPELVRMLCKNGCKNYNFAGGCPPLSPLFEEISDNIQSIFLVRGTFLPEYKTEAVKNSSRIYVHFRLQDQILSRLLHRIGLKIREDYGALFLGTGFCMGCGGKRCNFKQGMNYCLNPSKRTYSMESTGLNVCQTLKNVFGIELSWYKKGERLDIPLTKCCALIFKNNIEEITFSKILMDAYQAYELKRE